MRDALSRFDFEAGGPSALGIILAHARPKDGITLWYLLRKVDKRTRSDIYDRLVQLVPPPTSVSRTGIMQLNEQMMQAWRERLDYASLGLDPRAIKFDTGAVRPGGTLNEARFGHTATLLPNGKVLVVGGEAQATLASAELYDPKTETFTETGQMATARYKIRDAVILLANGKILVAGSGERLEIYDPDSGIFTPVPGSIGAPKFMSTVTLLPNGNVVIIGGYSSTPDQQGIRLFPDTGAWLYTPATGK